MKKENNLNNVNKKILAINQCCRFYDNSKTNNLYGTKEINTQQ